ncbi:putative hydroxymethylpyrimidine transporter CytX [Crassaminicella profunda]|uniref:putative hydroxymethylpyrimidine transporter CytX n=1 Tax=Crassaminicella profunda TaxID=1286698 RepID=UPI001CA7B3F9|nr:putative hydroxymethylpyrimidine transporter CytX [Crassaminicella profunda]QZY53992.1 putative hydroxymethylpyrimidine transporter CytX [Crassaminicella profunda]
MTNEKLGLSSFHLLALWFGASISIAEILTGGLLAPMGFSKAFTAILIGHLIGTGILVLGGFIGAESKLPSIMSTRISFGSYGSYLFSILNVLQLIGWTAVMIISGGRSVNEITKILWSFDHLTLWSFVIGIFICLWIFLGKNGFQKLNLIAVALLFGLTIVLSTVVFKDSSVFTSKSVEPLSMGTAIELNVIMPLSWLPLISDYTRFSKNKKSGLFGSFIGYFVGSTWMYTIGLGAAIMAGNADPGSMMLAANLGLFGLGIIVLSTVTTTFLDAYSAGVTFLNVFPKLEERKVALAMGLIGMVLAILIPIEQYENFLYAIGSVFAPLFAVLMTDYFVFKKKNIEKNLLVHWGSFVIWAIGVYLYYQFINMDFFLGATVPVMMSTSILFIVTKKVTNSWVYLKKHPTALSE